ncbi:MAG TPA: saccharopine dehydrogenase C-terminal domain-containing protein [Bryobacteraceae bacterium]|jgi:saccharopine dehydrogenase-like NADP-dependent oxidoreductase|nr:saccharopine dehydrogenase C-terminal domain-containing protein [Bryobacteraceae bacterium]
MFAVMVVGAGRIGASIAKLLHNSGDYEITVADHDAEALERLVAGSPVRVLKLEVDRDTHYLTDELRSLASGRRTAVLSACSFDVNRLIALSALEAGVSYFDLTEDVETTRQVRALAAKAADGQIFMPQCGLAPGFIGILAASMINRFDRLDALRMRVGALPEFPHNHLMYHLTWSTSGMINEYCKPCDVIHRGRRQEVLALDGLERFAIDGVEYEAFNTSGGLGTLCETLEGKVNELNYKTVRYPGHHYLMDFLINGLRMGDTLDTQRELGRIFDRAIPMTRQDVVLVMCAASGWRQDLYSEETNARKIYHQQVEGEHWSAIQVTTAAAACVAVDLFRDGKLPIKSGFVRQEDVELDVFLANRFGQYYAFDAEHTSPVIS